MYKITVKIISLILAAVMLLTVFGCEGEDKDIDTVLELASGEYKVVRMQGASDVVTDATYFLCKKLESYTGVEFSFTDDFVRGEEGTVKNDDPEILVGETNRYETKLAKKKLPKEGYIIKVIGQKLVILGTNESLTMMALCDFEDKILKNSEHTGEGKLTFGGRDTIKCEAPEKLQLSDLIDSGAKFTVTAEEVYHCEPDGIYAVAQGACCDGKYFYFLLRQSGDGDAVIKKVRMSDKKVIKTSKPVHVFHGNDMTYDYANKRLILIHGSSEGKIVTSMDPDTMEVIEQSINIPKGAGAMSYSKEKKLFAVSQGGKTLHILTNDLKTCNVSYDRTDNTGYTAQGMGSDEKYVYFPMSGSSDNILVAYTWDGKYAATVHIPVSRESESMYWVDGDYYVNFYSSKNGAFLYKLDFVLKFE